MSVKREARIVFIARSKNTAGSIHDFEFVMFNWMGEHWGTLPDWKLDDAIDHNMIFPAEAVLICRAVVARWTIFVVISSVSIIAADWGSLSSAGKHDSGRD